MTLYFFHGKESTPQGSKYHSLTSLGPVKSPDFQNMDIHERLEKAERVTADEEEMVVVGSSMGGLLASLLYDRHPERFAALVLLAPALNWEVADKITEMPPPECVAVIHGRRDQIVPLEDVQQFCAKFDIDVEVVDDAHRLADSHDRILEVVRGFLNPNDS